GEHGLVERGAAGVQGVGREPRGPEAVLDRQVQRRLEVLGRLLRRRGRRGGGGHLRRRDGPGARGRSLGRGPPPPRPGGQKQPQKKRPYEPITHEEISWVGPDSRRLVSRWTLDRAPDRVKRGASRGRPHPPRGAAVAPPPSPCMARGDPRTTSAPRQVVP